MAMSHRERVVAALEHRESDRVPVDFGGGPATQIHPEAYSNLLAHLGYEEENLPVSHRGEGQVVAPSERVLQRFDADVRGFYPGNPDVSQGRAIDESSYVDEWSVTWRKSAVMAPYINVLGPLQHIDDPVPADVSTVKWPEPNDPGRIRGLRESVQKMRNETDYAIVLNLPNCTFALCQRVRGFTEMFEDLLTNASFATALQEQVTDTICGIAELALGAVGDLIDAVSTADDLGVQNQSFMSASLYRTMVKPHHARFIETLHRHTPAPVILHSDGSVYELLPDIIDAGVQVLNPVQVSAGGMDPERLKREFGNDLAFWGGIDTQHVLPFGTASDVEREVGLRSADLGRGGGYVLGSVHNIQSEVPPENIVAMFDTAIKSVRV